MRASFFLLGVLFLSTPGLAHAQECRADGTPKPFEDRYAETLGGAAAGAVLMAGAGAILGLAVPALICPAGVGDGGCEAAWALGVGGFGGAGFLLGLPIGMAATEHVKYDDAQAGQGFGMIVGGLFVGAGLGLADSTNDEGFLWAGMIGWALTQVFLGPLIALAFTHAPRCGPPRNPVP